MSDEGTVALITATLMRDVDTGFGTVEPLHDVYHPPEIARAIYESLADSGRLVTQEKEHVISAATAWRGRFGKLLNQGCDCVDCQLMGDLTVAVDALEAP